jgi:IQ domain-containing protein D
MAAPLQFPQPQQFETINMTLPSHMQPQPQQQADLKRKKFKLEPIKVLEPSSKKLTLPEAQRIMFIMDELLKKLEYLEYLNLIINNEEIVKSVLHANLSDDEEKSKFDQIFLHMCKYHRDLVRKYDQGEYVEDNNDESATGQSKHTLEAMIKNSCRDLMRIFHLKSSLFDNLKKQLSHLKKDDKELKDIQQLFAEVRVIIHDRLLTTPVEKKEKIEYIKELLLREKTNNEIIKKLQEELRVAFENKQEEIQKRNNQIRELDASLKQVERFGADLVKRTKLEAEQQEASEIKASDGRK